MSTDEPIAVIGAGLAGLAASAQLQAAGRSVIVYEQADRIGGRLAAEIFNQPGELPATFDHGAQFFTVRDPVFQEIVAGWLARGVIVEWSRGFATADGSFYADGHARYRGVPDMTALALDLANNLEVRLGTEVVAISAAETGWQIRMAGGYEEIASALVLTPPVPQALTLLERGGTTLPPATRKVLDRIRYEPCLAALVQLAEPGQVPEPGGLWPLGEPIVWLADNYRKGVSARPGAITIHAGPEFSQANWSARDDLVVAQLTRAAQPWLNAPVGWSRVFRWRYSKPLWLHRQPFLAVSDPGGLVLAGDAFAGPRVEGAVLSGLAAADWLSKND